MSGETPGKFLIDHEPAPRAVLEIVLDCQAGSNRSLKGVKGRRLSLFAPSPTTPSLFSPPSFCLPSLSRKPFKRVIDRCERVPPV